ncbi:uncharacterized protein LOC113032046 [Astatotilapia calliptera]|uniref:uncharacterized protein LOC113032046 n=1 Tax=Astatotilapia calliptera TaxID=8154 RepID=UPI000E416470|nr:uncharacterized protein LOC113032046 [Astatotilapia calliptera]
MDIPQKSCTRRGMLSISSSIYDPLGFLAPVLLPAKGMQQELCKRKLGWDEPIPQTMLQKWKGWLSDLQMLSHFKVKRCIQPREFGPLSHAQLHHFSDAGESGYGTVSYLRMQDNRKSIHVAFLMGKARVTPLKPVTIPRLELTAAVVAVRVDLMLRAQLRMKLEQSIFWTDSTSVLKYIMNEDKRFLTFVANRVSFITTATKQSQWRYVSSKENPADDATRGLKAGNVVHSSRWIKGPSFLQKPESDWPTNLMECSLELEDPEVKGPRAGVEG